MLLELPFPEVLLDPGGVVPEEPALVLLLPELVRDGVGVAKGSLGVVINTGMINMSRLFHICRITVSYLGHSH